MSRRRLVLALLIMGMLTAAGAQTAGGAPTEHVILVSVDGLLPESYLRPDAHGLKIPTLRAMVRDGAYSEGVESVFPTMTYPAHTSMVTGANPGTHGITTNRAPDPLEQNREGWRWYAEDIRVPTLWDAARAKGLRTALVWWPVTVGARADYLVPEYWRAHIAEDIKLVRALSTPGLLEEVARRFPRLLDGLVPPEVDDESVTDIAVHLLETARPSLLLLHLLEVDRFQHRDGPHSVRGNAAVEKADRMLARLIAAAQKAGIWHKTVLVVASDHGFARYQRTVRPGALLREHGLVTLDQAGRVRDWKAVVNPNGGTAYLYLRDADDEGSRRRLLEIFRPLAGAEGSGIARVYTPEEIRKLGGDPEAALALEAAPGFYMSGGWGEMRGSTGNSAGHGFHPARADMQASLLMFGPAVPPQKLAGARLIDIAPTIAGLLGMEMKTAAGSMLGLRLILEIPTVGRQPMTILESQPRTRE